MRRRSARRRGPPTDARADDHSSGRSACRRCCRAAVSFFFEEEGFVGDRSAIAANLEALWHEPHHRAAIAIENGRVIGIVTVTTMLYIEWGRLGEIDDLYVLPEERRHGVARALVRASLDWCREQGCTAVEVVMTPEGEAAHGLSRFYAGFGFTPSGRKISVLHL